MEKIAYRLTEYLCRHNAIENSEFELYEYGILSGIELVLCVGCSLLISLMMGTTVNVIIFWMIFLGIRSYVGGIHLDRYSYCFFFSCLVCNIVCLISNVWPMHYKYSFILVTISAGIILWLAYIRWKKEKENFDENRYLLKKLLQNICIIISSMYFLYKLSYLKYVSQCAYTMLIIAVFALAAKVIDVGRN